MCTNVAIEYTATSLSIRAGSIQVSPGGFEKAWQDVGTRRTAYYNNLPPGRYAFRVMAANEDGVWNTQGAVVSLVVPPFFIKLSCFGSMPWRFWFY